MWTSLKTSAVRERLTASLWIFALVALLAIISVAASIEWNPSGRLVEAHVEQFGVRADYYGFQPLLTVRLADGSKRQLLAPRLARGDCKRGDKVALVQRGSALTLGVRGCYR